MAGRTLVEMEHEIAGLEVKNADLLQSNLALRNLVDHLQERLVERILRSEAWHKETISRVEADLRAARNALTGQLEIGFVRCGGCGHDAHQGKTCRALAGNERCKHDLTPAGVNNE
jgi:hypothetical protein